MDQLASPKKKRLRKLAPLPEAPPMATLNGVGNSKSSSVCDPKDLARKILPLKVENTAIEERILSSTSEQSEHLEPWNMFTTDLVTPKIEPEDPLPETPNVFTGKPDSPSVALEKAPVTIESIIAIEPQSPELLTPKTEPEELLPDEVPTCIKIDKVVTLKNEPVTPWAEQATTAASVKFGNGLLGEEYVDFGDDFYASGSHNDIHDEIEMLHFKNKHLMRENVKLELKVDTLVKCCTEAAQQKSATLLKIQKLENNNKKMNAMIRKLEKRNDALSSKVDDLQGERTDLEKIVKRLNSLK